MTYKGYKYYQKYTNTQIANVKNVITGWMNKYNIPFNYDWNELFDPNTLSKKALRGEKGVYTHNSVRTGKQDVFPQKELIDMFKSIATNINEPAKANSIEWEILLENTSIINNGVNNQYQVSIKLRGTLNGESLEFEDTSYYSAADYTQQEAIDAQILYVKEGVVEDGENEGNNDWINAENTVPIE